MKYIYMTELMINQILYYPSEGNLGKDHTEQYEKSQNNKCDVKQITQIYKMHSFIFLKKIIYEIKCI